MYSITKKSILFVCLGNICRSPAAEGIFRSIIEERGENVFWTVDSAGTYGGHAGGLPDSRMRRAAARRGYELVHRARQVKSSDFDCFDLIISMDDSNYSDLMHLAPSVEDARKVRKMIDFCQPTRYDHIPDPYYEGVEGFELVIDLLEVGCQQIIEWEIKNRETRE